MKRSLSRYRGGKGGTISLSLSLPPKRAIICIHDAVFWNSGCRNVTNRKINAHCLCPFTQRVRSLCRVGRRDASETNADAETRTLGTAISLALCVVKFIHIPVHISYHTFVLIYIVRRPTLIFYITSLYMSYSTEPDRKGYPYNHLFIKNYTLTKSFY